MHDSNGRIFTQNGQGIDVRADVAYVLGRSTGDVGQLCGDVDANGTPLAQPKITSTAVYKPYRSSSLATTEADRFAANYGWDILKKPAYSSLANLLPTIDSREDAGTPIWQHLAPRGKGGGAGGADEMYRILDFNGYRHNPTTLGEPIYMNRLTKTNIPNIQNTDFVVPANANNWSGSADSASFELRDAFELQFNIDITDPSSASTTTRLYFEVDVYVSIFDSNNRAVFQEHVEISADGINQHPQKHLRIGSYLSGSGYYHIHYDFTCGFNQSEYTITGDRIPVTFTVSIPSSYTMQLSNTGRDGIVFNPKWSTPDDWKEFDEYRYSPRRAVFGDSAMGAIVVIKVTDGSTTQTKICIADGPIVFDRIGITVQPRASTSENDILVYLFYGNYVAIFPDYQSGTDYSDITAGPVLQNELIPAPHCRWKLGILQPQPGPMEVHQDDCQGATFTYAGGTVETGLYPHQPSGMPMEGFTSNENGLRSVQIDWAFFIDGLYASMPFFVHLDIYNGDDELVGTTTNSYTATPNAMYYWGVTAELLVQEVGSRAGEYSAYELYAKIWIEVDDKTYYLDIGRSLLMETDPGYYRLGWQE